jgi:N-methylhydantoinase A
MVDIHSVGAGGGSIARADIGGALKVGPESAGADPGPVCYGRGRDITVTDANLYLGRLDAERFLGGRMRLDLQRTRARMKALAGELGMNPTRAAAGVLQVVNHNMERAIRAISVERGYDPAEFTLVAFGGAAGLHAAEMVAGLRLAHIVIPRWPGLLSAWGMAQTPYARDFARSLLQRNPQFKALEKQFAALVSRGLGEVEREGLERKEIAVSLSVDMRYAGQAYEVTVPWSEKFARQFHRLHEARFGHANPDHDVEVVALRARLEGRRLVRAARPQPVRKGKGLEAYQGMKQAYFTRGYRRCRTYQRERLRPGDRIVGPSIIYEFSSTVLVPPGWRAEVDGYRNLHLLRRGRSS